MLKRENWHKQYNINDVKKDFLEITIRRLQEIIEDTEFVQHSEPNWFPWESDVPKPEWKPAHNITGYWNAVENALDGLYEAKQLCEKQLEIERRKEKKLYEIHNKTFFVETV